MGEPSAGRFQPEKAPEDRLDSWKEIAAYLGRDVTTVQRWEKREGMPVHRHQHDRMGSVYASRTELDDWVRGRNLRAERENQECSKLLDSAPPSTDSARSAPVRRSIWIFAVVGVAVAIGLAFWLKRTEYFWRSPIAEARFQPVTDFGGLEQAAAISRDAHFVAFESDRDGQVDVWVTQLGSGQFHNLTKGRIEGLGNNPFIRILGFSPDGSLVTFWMRKRDGSKGDDISEWAVPTLGGQPKLYLEGVAEYDWSPDGTRLAYHTPGPGDPLFVSDGTLPSEAAPIFTAPPGIHSHFPLWAPDGKYIYFVEGSIPDKLDIWRVPSGGGTPERITSTNGRISYPVLINQSTLVYLASDPDGSGPQLYSVDVNGGTPHRLTSGIDRYTSLSASADGRRLVATVATPKRTLWRLSMDNALGKASAPTPISLTTSTGYSPRLGPGYLLYLSATGTRESIWKFANGVSAELWNGQGAHIFGGPAISRDRRSIAFSVRKDGKTLLYTMQADGTNVRIVSDSLELQGEPAWAPDGQSITSAVNENGVPHLFRFALNGQSPSVFVRDYSMDPAWAPGGSFVIYSGPDIGTMFPVKAATDAGAPQLSPSFNLTRGARHMAFLPGGTKLVLLRGEIEHKNLWVRDLTTGEERQLTNLGPEFDVRDFDVSPDGREIVLERVQDRSDVVMLDLPKR